MKTFKIFNNPNKKSFDVAADLRGKLLATGQFIEIGSSDRDRVASAREASAAEFVFSVGGDGCFLKSVRETVVSDDTKFIGVNTGTLGFLQSVKPDAVDVLVRHLADGEYHMQKLSFIKCTATFDGGEHQILHSLNELVVRNENLHILDLKIRVDGEELETYAGDGVLVATSTGSTAYNLSLGGSIVHERFHTLQLTPIAPLTTIAHSLTNSLVMPEGSFLEMSPAKRAQDLLVCTDGYNTIIRDVAHLKVELDKRRVNRLIIDEHSFWQRINEKILRRGN